MGVHCAGTVHAQVALVSGHLLPGDRPLAESGAFHRPTLVNILLEIIEHDLRALGASGFHRRGPGGRTGQQGAAVQGGHSVSPHDPLEASARIDQHGVFQPADDFRLHGFAAGVFQFVTHDRRRVAGIVEVQRNEGRIGLQFHPHRTVGVGIGDGSYRIGAAKGHALPAGTVQVPELGLPSDCQPKGKTLLER